MSQKQQQLQEQNKQIIDKDDQQLSKTEQILKILKNQSYFNEKNQEQIYDFFFNLPFIDSRIKPYFQEVLKTDLLNLVTKLKLIHKKKGEILFQDNQKINQQFIILQGSVGLFSPDPDNIYIKNVVLEKTQQQLKYSQIIYDTDIQDWQYLILDNQTYVKTNSIFQGEEVGIFAEDLQNGSVSQDQACATLEDTYYIQIEGQVYYEHLGKHLQRLEVIYNTLMSHYQNLETRDAIKMAYKADELKRPNLIEPIYKEGDRPDGVYIVFSGEFVMKKKILHPSSQNIYNIDVYKVNSGGLFGADEVHQKNTRVFSAYSRQQFSQYYYIDKKYVSSKLIIKAKQIRTGEFLSKCIKQQLDYIGYAEVQNNEIKENLQYDNEDQILPLIEAEKKNLYRLQEYNLLEYQNLSDAASQIQFTEIQNNKANIQEIYRTSNNHFNRSVKNFQRKRFEKDRNLIQMLNVPQQEQFIKKKDQNQSNKKIINLNRPRGSFSHQPGDNLTLHKYRQKKNKFLDSQQSKSNRKQSMTISGGGSHTYYGSRSEVTSQCSSPRQGQYSAYHLKSRDSNKNLMDLYQYAEKKLIEQKLQEKKFQLNKLPVTLFISKDLQDKTKQTIHKVKQKSQVFKDSEKLDSLEFNDLQQTINKSKDYVINDMNESLYKKQRSFSLNQVSLEQSQELKSQQQKNRPVNLLQNGRYQTNYTEQSDLPQIHKNNNVSINSIKINYTNNNPQIERLNSDHTDLTPIFNKQDINNFYHQQNSMQEQSKEDEDEDNSEQEEQFLTEEQKLKLQKEKERQKKLQELNSTWMDKIKKTSRKKISISRDQNEHIMYVDDIKKRYYSKSIQPSSKNNSQITQQQQKKTVRFDQQQLTSLRFQQNQKQNRHQKMLQLKYEYSKDRDYLSCKNKTNTIDYIPKPKHHEIKYDYKKNLQGGEPFRRAPLVYLRE